jgi:hypothetical protein
VFIDPTNRPRTADFAYLGEAVFKVHQKESGEFLDSFHAKRKDGVYRTIDASPVGAALLAYLEEHANGWRGTLTDLLSRLERYKPVGESSWPRSAKGLGDSLRRLAPALRMIGYTCNGSEKIGGAINWHIFFSGQKLLKQCPGSPVSPDLDAKPAEFGPFVGHAGHAGLGLNSFKAEKGTSALTQKVY